MEHRVKTAVFGSGGHARVIIDILEKQGIAVDYLLDDNEALHGSDLLGYRIAGGRHQVTAGMRVVPAIGSNAAREALQIWLEERQTLLMTAIHPAATIGRDVAMGAGSVVMAGAVINPSTTLGRGVIVNTLASVDHDCIIEDFCHIAPGVTICGGCSIGYGSFICAGATVGPGVTIGAGTVVGAGSTVIRNLPAGVVAVGSPSRIKRTITGGTSA